MGQRPWNPERRLWTRGSERESEIRSGSPGLPAQTLKKSYCASVLHPASKEIPALSASHTIGSKRFAFGPQKKTPLFQQDVHTKSKVICSDSPRLLRRRVNSPTGSANVAMQNKQPSMVQVQMPQSTRLAKFSPNLFVSCQVIYILLIP